MLRCHVPKHLTCPIVAELQNALNNDLSKLKPLVTELRFWIAQQRCEKTLQHLPATAYEKLSLLHPADHPIAKIGPHKVYIKFHRQPNIVLITELKQREDNVCEMEYKFYLVFIRHTAIDEEAHAASKTDSNIPKVFLRVQSVIEFDTFASTHGSGTAVDGKIFWSFCFALVD